MFRLLFLPLAVVPLAALIGGEPSPFVSPTSEVMLALKVTAAVQAQPSLKELPLTVDVARGVAVVAGELPDDAAAAKLREVVAAVPGLAGSRIDCRVTAGDDPFLARVREKLAGKPPTPFAAAPRVELPAQVDRRIETRVTALRPASREAAAEALRSGDARFAGLTLSFADGVVTVSGSAATHEDVTALMLHLRKVPGVQRVRRGSIAAAG